MGKRVDSKHSGGVSKVNGVRTKTINEQDDLKPHEKNGVSRFNQFLLLSYCVLPWVLLLTLPSSPIQNLQIMRNVKGVMHTPYTIDGVLTTMAHEFYLSEALTYFNYFTNPKFIALLAVNFIPHFLYFIVWLWPNLWYGLASKTLSFLGEPYKSLAFIAHCIKLTQLYCFLMYFYPQHFMPENIKENFADVNYLKDFSNEIIGFILSQHLLKYVVLVQFFILGQFLNLTVYQVLGEVGVYYGAKLRKHIPWVTGFPYNTINHAQYLGSGLSIIGVVIFISTPQLVENGLYGCGAALVEYYMFSSFVEGSL